MQVDLWLGVVEDNIDPKKMQRIRCVVSGLLGDGKSKERITRWVYSPKPSSLHDTPKIGDTVLLASIESGVSTTLFCLGVLDKSPTGGSPSAPLADNFDANEYADIKIFANAARNAYIYMKPDGTVVIEGSTIHLGDVDAPASRGGI